MATTQIIAEPAVPQLVVTSEFAAPRDLPFRAIAIWSCSCSASGRADSP